MLNTKIIFIRHGELDNPDGTFYERGPVPLSDTGILNIRSISEKLKEMGLTPFAIYSSPTERALQSSQIILEVFNSSFIISDERLNERNSSGLRGKDIASIESQCDGDLYNFLGRDYEIEHPEQIAKRMLDFVLESIVKHQGKTILAVSHGDPITFAIWKLRQPENNLPSISYIRNTGEYLKKSYAWKVLFDSTGRILERSLITYEKSTTDFEFNIKHNKESFT